MNNQIEPNQSTSTDYIQQEIENFRDRSELDHATFHLISTVDNHFKSPFVKTTYPLEWIHYYLIHNLLNVDPVVRVSRSSDEPFHWDDIILSNEERKMMAAATDHGMSTHGYTVPTFDVGPYRGLFSIVPHVDASSSEWRDHVERHKFGIHDFAFTLHRTARVEVDPYDSYTSNLSPREIECLNYISSGKTHSEIAAILNLSEHTVRSYLRTLRLKLNCATLAQAVAKASAQNII